jgi:hypothetical protein
MSKKEDLKMKEFTTLQNELNNLPPYVNFSDLSEEAELNARAELAEIEQIEAEVTAELEGEQISNF